MKKIGFIDYFLDEWHANNFPKWIRESSYAGKIDLTYAWGEIDKEGGLTSQQWCEKYGAELSGSLEEIVEKSDYLMVLSPDHPERHEDLAALALTAGKPLYIDKTFAPDLAAAKRLFARAKDHGTPLCSSSALRFAEELDKLQEQAGDAKIHYAATGGPGKFGTYAVHQVEMIVATLGTGAQRVMQVGNSEVPLMVIDYPDGRRARLEQLPSVPFNLAAEYGDGKAYFAPSIGGAFFPRFIEEVLKFFDTGEVAIPEAQTLEVMAILEAGRKGLEKPDQWVDVPK